MAPGPVSGAVRVVLEAPFGHAALRVRDAALARVELSPQPAQPQVPEAAPAAVVDPVRAYLAGEVDRPSPPLAGDRGATAFQREVWEALVEIPRGTVRTYGEHARSIGRPRAARAVGQALARNPLPLVWPCHRVVAADGLGGFGGSPADGATAVGVKRWLLEREGAIERA
jgi:methylated-DNA-[protein]-cysteine S-methyltransferase